MRLIVFLLGLVIGGYAVHVYDQRNGVLPGSAPSGANGPDDEQLHRWHLDSDQIRSDLQRTGEVVREGAQVAGQKIDDGRIIAVITAKYVLDHDLSALDIHVECHEGDVTLTGTVAAPNLVAKAVATALDTSGVKRVTSRLQVK
jgi:hypothetical protein